MITNTTARPIGLTNRIALGIIAAGYPLGMILCSLVYVSSVKDTFWEGSSVQAIKNDGQLSKGRATKVIESWWAARKEVYGPPYDRNKVQNVVSDKGPLWKTLDNTKSPIRWLKANKRSQMFAGRVKKIISFDAEQERPQMTVLVEATTSIKGGSSEIAKEKTTSRAHDIVFVYEDDKWKIWSYKSQK